MFTSYMYSMYRTTKNRHEDQHRHGTAMSQRHEKGVDEGAGDA